MKRYFLVAMFSSLLLGLNGCKDYFDINYDPNSPAEENLTSDMIIPAAEMNIAATYASTLHILGAYNVQYYAEQFGTPNYVPYSQFLVTPTNGNGTYRQLFQRALSNLNIVKKKATESGQNGVLLQATVLRAFAYQLLVDAFGEVPFTEAFDPDNLSPRYDEGQFIYESLIQEIDDALAAVGTSDPVATSFIIPSKSTAEWIKFANAQKLKMLTRMSSADGVDKSAEIKAIIDGGNLPAADVQIAGCWKDASGQANPFYSEERATWGIVTHNIIANLALVGTLNTDSYTDPRLAAWFLPNKEGKYQGSISGTNLSTAKAPYNTTDAWCELVLDYNTPVIFISKAEIEFFIAEYYAKASDATNAKIHYDAAIEASFATANVDGAAAHIAQFPYKDSEKWKRIGLEKWKALAGINGFEGYTEARRLGYPRFGALKASDIFDGSGALDLTKYQPDKLYEPFQKNSQVKEYELLQRFPYPEFSTSRNQNAPAFPGYNEPIFWDKVNNDTTTIK